MPACLKISQCFHKDISGGSISLLYARPCQHISVVTVSQTSQVLTVVGIMYPIGSGDSNMYRAVKKSNLDLVNGTNSKAIKVYQIIDHLIY